jgi:uncharacterized protein (DUF2147 family)/peptidoglycan/LPS O-acetylase OafA/YrhL
MTMADIDTTRRADIDALRILATFLLLPFHVAMIFSPAPFYHVRSDEPSVLALVFAGFVSLWHMPLFFLLAGWSAVASIRMRGTRAFARERVTRLLIPLVVGCVLFGPAIKYIELRGGQDFNHRGLFVAPEVAPTFASVVQEPLPAMAPFDESFVEFLPSFFTSLDRFTWSHLWFVAYLFTLSLVWLPLLARLGRGSRVTRAAGSSGVSGSRWAVYAPIPLLAAIQILLRPHWPGVQNLYNDWANVAYYSTYLMTGAVLAAYPTFEDSVRLEARRAFVVSMAAMAVLLSAVLGIVRSEPLVLALTAVAGWTFTLALLGTARELNIRPTRAIAYLSEASMPIYILHQPAIVFLAAVALTWPVGAAVQFSLILVGAVSVTLVAYDVAARRVQLLRLAFGMKPLACGVRWSARGVAGIALASLLGAAAARAEPMANRSPIGLWWAEGGAAQVRVSPCGEALCGRIVWLRSPFDENGCELRDRYNPDPSLRGRQLIGTEIVRHLVAQGGAEEWAGGAIYDPTSGRTYECVLRLRDTNRLEVRGYIGFRLLGRTVTWTRVGTEARTCME